MIINKFCREERGISKKLSALMSIMVIGVLFSAINISQIQAKGPKPEIGAKQITTQINGQRKWQFTRYLTSDEMAGRLAGTEGEDLAAGYISKKFRQWGLEPAGFIFRHKHKIDQIS